MFRTAFLILTGNASASILLLARNLVVARLISVADYGIAATFAIIVSLLEMASAFGLQQQIVQSRRGDDPAFQATLQGFQLLRGIVSGAILFALGGMVADLLNLPQVAWAYRTLAVVPVLNALQHFDIHRLNRGMAFGPLIATNLVPAAFSLTLVWPLAKIFGDWRVMLWTIVVHAALMAVVSHLVAQRRWQVRLERGLLAETLRFGWPLLLNNLLLFAVFNGDRVIVGREIGPAALGIFAMGVTLTLTPTLVLAKSAQNFFLPQISGAAPEMRSQIARVTIETVLTASLVFMFAVWWLGGPFIVVILGEKFAELVPLLTLFGLVQAVRILKAGPSIIALANGRTANALIGNLPRVAVLPIIFHVAATSGDLTVILCIAILSELAGYIVALAILGRSATNGKLELLAAHVFAISAFAFLAADILAAPSDLWIGASAVAGFLALAFQRGLQHYVFSSFTVEK